MSRKYRQPGYQDGGTPRSEERRRPERGRTTREGPRSPRMMGFQQVVRCAMCGASLPPSFDEIHPESVCPSCDVSLHTCRNCVYFDTSARFECTQPVLKRVVRKDQRNNCQFFEAKSRVEKKITSTEQRRGASPSSLDPREAFERLFKK